ncbi:tRNA methyltransferase 1 like S homeolog isoform X2 [Xenopus laevis]|uniref:tRNA (guanine(26)-N(2))-dimethyltransferase n=2 Tax=Xenopus laevis TaxID=8355 RepID=A0A974HMF2_XENLA|nr:tRNA methyltransferase 1 like S homeolog isoform X2 [Xenopus laevis]OCT82981.1 hypothetical protein XELAEV_18025517mg [Xenopus laevis]
MGPVGLPFALLSASDFTATKTEMDGNDCKLEKDVSEIDLDVHLTSKLKEKHISIQNSLRDLEGLAEQNEGEKKPCPLCPEETFKPCLTNKLLKHLQNLHWKVSVEFEDYRMCICCLPCMQQKPSQDKEGVPPKTACHYHCSICSATISRRTEMISHVKRHATKGETDGKYSPGHFQKTLKELNTHVQVSPNFKTPQKTDTFFNPKMKVNRQLIFCALVVLAKERKPIECLDAFGSTGIMGLQWAKHLGKSVKVTINDISESSVAMIRDNCLLNNMKVLTKKKDDEEEENEVGEDSGAAVEVTQYDANVLMHLRAFDFIHLDPFGTSVNYLDAAFRNVRNLGIVSVTSTDTGSLFAKTLNVAKRHYGCNIVRTEYYKELAARIILASVARAAARCGKGIEVLLSVAVEHFVLVVVRVLRGATQTDESVQKINTLIHCQWCEERIFQKEGNMVQENPYKNLPCDCQKSMQGNSAVVLGPMWSGSLFNTGFLRRMMSESVEHEMDDLHPLLKTLICEAECTPLKQFSLQPNQANQEESGVLIKVPDTTDYSADPGKRKRQDISKAISKRLKNEAPVEHPPFYYSIHRHSIRGLNIPKLNKFLQYLSEEGFKVSRTHFDPTGIRTNASLATFKTILEKNSTISNTSQASNVVQTAESRGQDLLTEEAMTVCDTK